MESVELIGFMAGTFGAISLLPQVLKSWKTKSTKDIAISWTLISLCGQVLWMTYGYYIQSVSLVVMSSITLAMVVSLVILKLKFG